MEFTTHLELHSQTTRLFEGTLQRTALLATRDSHPLWRPVPRNIDKERPQSCPLQITTRAPKVPDFKFELLPLHSPLLRQSRLVSFPPLIDMKDRNGMDLTEAEDTKNRWQKYTEELYQKNLNDPDNHDVITHLEPNILECKAGLRKNHYDQSCCCCC